MDALSKIGNALVAVAPTIASLFGTPLAGMAVTAAEQALGLAPGTAESNPNAVIAAMQNPDAAVKLAQVDAELKEKLAQGGIDLAKLGIEDTNSARQREVQTKDWMPKFLAMGTLGLFVTVICSIVYAIFAHLLDNITPLEAGLLGSVITYVVNDHKQVIAYYFGSSLGSANKDETIKTLSNGAA